MRVDASEDSLLAALEHFLFLPHLEMVENLQEAWVLPDGS